MPDRFLSMNMREIGHVIRNEEVNFILNNPDIQQPNESSFADIYSPEEIRKDQELVVRYEEVFDEDLEHANLTLDEQRRIKEGKKRSEALEATIVGLADFAWFGQNTYMSRTTKYDDIVNGVDVVLEFDDEESDDKNPTEAFQRIALAIDASTDSRREVVRNKINRNLKKISGQHKRPCEIKYFESKIETDKQGNGVKKKLEHIIPVVISLESNQANELMSLYVRFLKLKTKKPKTQEDKKTFADLQKKISEHPAQAIFLNEIIVQLEMYAHKINASSVDSRQEILDEIKNLRDTFIDISVSSTNKVSREAVSSLQNDTVYLEIKSYCRENTK